MKAVILYCSFSGNTEYVANQIKDLLEKAGHSAQCINAVPVIREMHLIRRAPAKSKDPQPTGKEPLYCAMKAAIAEAEILVLGTLVDGGTTPPGFAELLSDKWLPDTDLAHLKFTFTYTTCGEPPHTVGDQLATLIMGRKHSAVFAGNVDMRGTENWPCILPNKPQCYIWSPEENEEMIKKVTAIIQFMSQPYTSPPKSVPYKSVAVLPNQYALAVGLSGTPACDQTKCTKCGLCASHCPYGAITMKPGVEGGFPVVDPDLCFGCCICFNHCPSEAINFTTFDSTGLQRAPRPCTGPKDVEEFKKRGLEPIPLPPAKELDELFAKRAKEWGIKL